MGYTTEFNGKFNLNKPLDPTTYDALVKLSTERHGGNLSHDEAFPGFWCGWAPTQDRCAIEWNGSEKFYNYIEWLQLIIDRYLTPKGYVLAGRVTFAGEESMDRGSIMVTKNVVRKRRIS